MMHASHLVWAFAGLLLAADADLVEETGASGIFFGRGVVKAVEPASGALTLDHDAIKGCMPAMEMMFRVETPALSRNVHPGDVIDFKIDGGRCHRRGDGRRTRAPAAVTGLKRQTAWPTSAPMACGDGHGDRAPEADAQSRP